MLKPPGIAASRPRLRHTGLGEDPGSVRSLLDAMPGHVALVDCHGDIRAVNANWLRLAQQNGLPVAAAAGGNYFRVGAAAAGQGDETAARVAGGIRAVLDGREPEFSVAYPCDSASGRSWFRLHCHRMVWAAEPAALLTHTSLTEAELVRQTNWQSSRVLLETAQSVARLGSIEVDGYSGAILHTSGIEALFGVRAPPRHLRELLALLSGPSGQALAEAVGTAGDADTVFELEVQLETDAGARWLRVRNAHPRPPGLSSTIVFQDITAAREARERFMRLNSGLHQRVARHARELSAANRELEAFSYSVSHDLKSPLAAIEGFAHVLSDRLRDRLDEKEQRYLGRIQAGVASMHGLIDAMLTLHNVACRQPERSCVDLSAVARGVLAQLQEAEPHRPVRLRVQDGVVADCDRDLMQVVLGNVIGNAWKFSVRRAVTDIEFSATDADEGRGILLCVRDRGEGFDPAAAEKLFGPFQRLHHAADFPGTGLGLAIVRKIVRAHGGTVTADAAPGQGAAIRIFLPRQIEGTPMHEHLRNGQSGADPTQPA